MQNIAGGGGGGNARSETFLEFRGYEIASETIFGAIRCAIRRPDDSFTCMNIYPFHPLHRTAADQPCMGVRNGRHVSEGKGGPVETGLTGPENNMCQF